MNPRYYITYKHSEGSDIRIATTLLGRFTDFESAELHARIEFSGLEGFEISAIRKETRIEALVHSVTRFVIRTFRICCGIALTVFAYVWSSDQSIGDTPFESLTLNMLGSALGHAILFIGALYFSWQIAFGEAPRE